MTASRTLVDPELLPGLDQFPAFTFSEEVIAAIRSSEPTELPCPRPRCACTVEPVTVPGPPGAPPVTALLFTPAQRDATCGAYLHIHGGGYATGSPEENAPFNAHLAAELGCIVVSVRYRLAPETRFPGAVEDCYSVLAWLHGEARALGIDPARIAIGGESAGGGHAAMLAFLARDRREFPVAHQQLIYPMLDDRTGSSRLALPHTGDYVWTAASNRHGWEALLGMTPGTDDVPSAAVPARRTDLAGLPPTFIASGALDLFVGENLAHAARLIAAGVPVEAYVAPGAVHGFDKLAPFAAVSTRFRAASLAALGNAISC